MHVCVLAPFMFGFAVTTATPPSPGQTVFGRALRTFVGGSGFNQAFSARRAGVEVSVIGRVGDDPFGEAFRHRLAAEGIILDHLAVDAGARTGIELRNVTDDGQESIVQIPGANAEVTRHDVALAVTAISNADVLLVGHELPAATVEAAIRTARWNGTRVVLKLAPARALRTELLDMVSVLVVDESESRRAAQVGPSGQIDEVVNEFWQRRGGILVVKPDAERHPAGSTGDRCWLTAKDAESHCFAAADAFCGMLGARLAGADEVADAVELASAAAEVNVTEVRVGGRPRARRHESAAGAVGEHLPPAPALR